MLQEYQFSLLAFSRYLVEYQLSLLAFSSRLSGITSSLIGFSFHLLKTSLVSQVYRIVGYVSIRGPGWSLGQSCFKTLFQDKRGNSGFKPRLSPLPAGSFISAAAGDSQEGGPGVPLAGFSPDPLSSSHWVGNRNPPDGVNLPAPPVRLSHSRGAGKIDAASGKENLSINVSHGV